MADLLQFPLPFFAELDPEPPEPHAGSEAFAPDPQETLKLCDADARSAALDIHRSWIVEAPAGSGKTGLLIQRFLKLLAFADIERPDEILAITFTRKASNELRTRVLDQLVGAASDQPLKPGAGDFERETRRLATAALARDREHGWRILESPHQLHLRTIDSFYGELAARVPLLSGGAGRRQPVEDARPLYEEAARRTLRQLGGPDPALSHALRSVLLHRDGQIGDCVRLVADMLGDREQWGKLIAMTAGPNPRELDDETLDRDIRPRLEKTLQRVLSQALQRAADAFDPDLLHQLAQFAQRLASEAALAGAESPLALCAKRSHAPGAAAEHLEHWCALVALLLTQKNEWRSTITKKDTGLPLEEPEKHWIRSFLAKLRAEDDRNPALRQALGALRCLPPAHLPEDQWRLAKALFRVLRHALIELTVLFHERGVSDFTELALTARSVLGEQPGLLETPGAQLTHLLVDEMQDTSTGQYELLELLTRGWDGRTKTLFLVGDPKQSIYYFRQARVERFLRTQASGRLGHVPLGALRLTANFRSQAELVQQFNQTFGLILPPPEDLAAHHGSDSAEVPFVAATPTRARGATPALHWHAHFISGETPSEQPEDDRDPPQPTEEQDALAIRGILEDFLARRSSSPDSGLGHKPRIAVLARDRGRLRPVIEELRGKHGRSPILFRAVDLELLNERTEVLDLLALTRALLHPADRVAWLAVLRSPVCGLTAADLLQLTGEGPTADATATVSGLAESRSHLLSPEGQQLLHRAWPVLARAQDSLGQTLFSTHVERTWRSLGADAVLRPDQLTNARRFLHLLQELEAGTDPLSIPLLEQRLGKLYAEPHAGPALVELMTIHKAKGLEWDLVFVPALDRGSGSSRHELLKWLELDGEAGAEAEIVLAPIAGKGEDRSPLSGWLASLQTARETAEAKRLFYVACTRAREELHLFATCELKQTGELAEPKHNCLLRAAWAAAKPALQLQRAEAAAAAATRPEPRPATKILRMPSPGFAAEPLALAAAADETAAGLRQPAQLQRLPAGFDPLARLSREAGPALPYVPATALRNRAPFQRPEGSFAARAFGNVVHRFLDLAADRLAGETTPDVLLAQLPQWRPRVRHAFRSEGLPPALSEREAGRALSLLANTLGDPQGRWLLSPHPGARSERALQLGPEADSDSSPRSLRADRTFFAGPDPLTSQETHLWIVDFKTADPGGRSVETFLAAEREKYLRQMQAYARACLAAPGEAKPIVLALFYPALTHLLYWPFDPLMASQQIESATDTVRR